MFLRLNGSFWNKTNLWKDENNPNQKLPKHSVTEALFSTLTPLVPWIHAPCTFSTQSFSLNFSLSSDELPTEVHCQPSRETGCHLICSHLLSHNLYEASFKQTKKNTKQNKETKTSKISVKVNGTNDFKATWRSGNTEDWPEDTAYSYTLCFQR